MDEEESGLLTRNLELREVYTYIRAARRLRLAEPQVTDYSMSFAFFIS